MRTDCKIDNRQIRCLHLALTAGSTKYIAKRGDLIRCRIHEGSGVFLARVLGRVTAPALGTPGTDDYTPRVDGWACCMVLSEDGHFAYERWVKPEDILQISNPSPAMAAFFMGPLPTTWKADKMRRLMEEGWTSEGGLATLQDPRSAFNR